MIEETLQSRLSGFAGLAALVGNRVYPVILPQNATLPAVTYQRISTPPRETAMGSDPGIAQPRFQITAWAETFSEVVDIKNQARLALERWRESGILDSFIEGEFDLYDEDAFRFGAAVDVRVIHEEDSTALGASEASNLFSLLSPDGTYWELTVDNEGALIVSERE